MCDKTVLMKLAFHVFQSCYKVRGKLVAYRKVYSTTFNSFFLTCQERGTIKTHPDQQHNVTKAQHNSLESITL